MGPGQTEPVAGVLARSQRAIVNVYTVIALLYCAASTWLYYTVADVPFLGLVHLVSFAVISVNYVILQRTGDYTLATHVILAVGTLVVSSQFALGGWGGTGYLWTFAYLPYAFFLATPLIARLWVGVLVAVDGILVGLGAAGMFNLAYHGVQLAMFGASLGIFLLCMFLFQSAVLHSEGLAEARSRELAKANAQLQASQAELAEAQALAHIGSWTWEPAIPRMTTSEELRRIAGMAGEAMPAELSGLLRFVHPDDHALVRSAVAATLADGRPLDFEARIIRRDGTQRLGHWLARAERDGAGKVVRLVGTTQDVTELHEAEEARRRAAHQVQDIESLREINRVRTQFMNTAAHELSTPLTPIRVELQLLRTPTFEDPAKRARALQIVERNVQRLSLLVQDLLDGAKLQASQLALQRATFDLNVAVQDAVRAHQAVAQQGGVHIDAAVAPGMWVDGDARRLAQVLDNLLGNAIKFTPPGGTVRVGLQRASGGIAVRVVDSGVGLRPSDITRLFQPFSQVHDTMQKTRAGSGLGLYIAKGIVEAHGGAIGVESAGLGHGSTFWFVLPATDAPAGASA